MFFLAATLVVWIGGDFVYRKVAAKNIFQNGSCPPSGIFKIQFFNDLRG